MQWLRLYHDTAHDPKWRVVAVECEQPLATVLGVWTYMLIFASQAKTRGTLEGWNDRVAGAALDIKGDRMTAIREAMQGVVLDGDKLTGWDRRQRNSDNVAERVRKHREANRPVTPDNDPSGVTSGNVTERNGNVTLHNANVTENPLRAQIQSQITEEESKKESPLPPEGGVSEQDLFQHPEPETDKPKKARKPAARFTPSQLKPVLDQFEAAYPAGDEVRVFETANKTITRLVNNQGVDPQALVAAAVRFAQAMAAKGKVGTQFIMKPNNWLMSGEWKKYDGVHHFPNQKSSFDPVLSMNEETMEQWKARTSAMRAFL